MNKHIFLRQVLEEIKKIDESGNAVPFDMEVRTYNRHNKVGGVLKRYSRAKLLIGKKMKGKPFIDAEHFFRQHRPRKNPNHWENRTRNIEIKPGEIRKINILLITKFNGSQVIY